LCATAAERWPEIHLRRAAHHRQFAVPDSAPSAHDAASARRRPPRRALRRSVAAIRGRCLPPLLGAQRGNVDKRQRYATTSRPLLPNKDTSGSIVAGEGQTARNQDFGVAFFSIIVSI